MERRNGNDTSTFQTDLRETVILQRVLEQRQAQLEGQVAMLHETLQGKEGMKEQLMIVRILSDQRHRATLCIGKWIAGVLAVLFAGLCYWVITETWQTRDAVKHLLSRPQATQQVPGAK